MKKIFSLLIILLLTSTSPGHAGTVCPPAGLAVFDALEQVLKVAHNIEVATNNIETVLKMNWVRKKIEAILNEVEAIKAQALAKLAWVEAKKQWVQAKIDQTLDFSEYVTRLQQYLDKALMAMGCPGTLMGSATEFLGDQTGVRIPPKTVEECLAIRKVLNAELAYRQGILNKAVLRSTVPHDLLRPILPEEIADVLDEDYPLDIDIQDAINDVALINSETPETLRQTRDAQNILLRRAILGAIEVEEKPTEKTAIADLSLELSGFAEEESKTDKQNVLSPKALPAIYMEMAFVMIHSKQKLNEIANLQAMMLELDAWIALQGMPKEPNFLQQLKQSLAGIQEAVEDAQAAVEDVTNEVNQTMSEVGAAVSATGAAAGAVLSAPGQVAGAAAKGVSSTLSGGLK